MSAGMKAIKIYIEALAQEYQRINLACRGPEYKNREALDEIKAELRELEKDLSTLELYHQTKKNLGNY